MLLRIPYETQVQVIAYRLGHTIKATAAKFDIAAKTVTNIMETNPELVEEMKAAIQSKVIAEAVRHATQTDR